jgi:hypothetical protein
MAIELLGPIPTTTDSIEYGLDYTLSHLEKPTDNDNPFPWRIMT